LNDLIQSTNISLKQRSTVRLIFAYCTITIPEYIRYMLPGKEKS